MTTLGQFSPKQEVYSIDESFLDLTGFDSFDLTEYGQRIRQQVAQWVGLPVCVGFGLSKTLAKLSNHVAKKRPQYQGVFDFSRLSAEEQDELLASIDAGEVWGIGRRLAERLAQRGIVTVKDLRDAEPKTLRREFSVVVERTVLELRGISCLSLEEVAQPKKEIISSRSFGQLVTDLGELRQAVASYTARAAEKLRRQHSVASALQVFLQTNPHEEGEPQYHPGIVVPLVEPTDDTRLLSGHAVRGLEKIYKPGYRYQKAGVMLMGLGNPQTAQLDLFSLSSESAAGPSKHLMQTLDQINAKLGRGTLRLAAEGLKQNWRPRANYPSPRYTTRWTDLPIAHAK